MPSLNFTGLQKLSLTPDKYTYADLSLDFKNPITKDLSADYDEVAVKNSIFSLFNTVPGQNLLNPDYGLNLVKYIFDPVSESNAQSIGNTILNHLNVYEPRIRVTAIDVMVNEAEQTYYITLSIEIPALANKTVKIPGTITKTGYIFS